MILAISKRGKSGKNPWIGVAAHVLARSEKKTFNMRMINCRLLCDFLRVVYIYFEGE
jgi:hypothetical protein